MINKSPYLHDIPLEHALTAFHDKLTRVGYYSLLGIEEIALDEHVSGRVLAQPIWARRCSPHYCASAMDGFAVNAEKTKGALPKNLLL